MSRRLQRGAEIYISNTLDGIEELERGVGLVKDAIRSAKAASNDEEFSAQLHLARSFVRSLLEDTESVEDELEKCLPEWKEF